MTAPEAGPIVYQSELSYFILRNMGVTQFDGHEAILIDFENITQNYKKPLDLTAYASNPEITIDGTAYPLMTYCTDCYPTTHGYLLLWPEGAPEGTLSAATSVTVGLKIARINGGHLDPIVDTRDWTGSLAVSPDGGTLAVYVAVLGDAGAAHLAAVPAPVASAPTPASACRCRTPRPPPA